MLKLKVSPEKAIIIKPVIINEVGADNSLPIKPSILGILPSSRIKNKSCNNSPSKKNKVVLWKNNVLAKVEQLAQDGNNTAMKKSNELTLKTKSLQKKHNSEENEVEIELQNISFQNVSKQNESSSKIIAVDSQKFVSDGKDLGMLTSNLSYPNKKNTNNPMLNELLTHPMCISPIKTEYIVKDDMKDSKDNISQFSIESKNQVSIQIRELKSNVPSVTSSKKKIVLYKANKGYDKIKREAFENSLYESHNDNITSNDENGEQMKNIDDASSFHNTRGTLLKNPIYNLNETFVKNIHQKKPKHIVKESNSIIIKNAELNSNSLSVSRQYKSTREAIALKTQNLNSAQDEISHSSVKHKGKQQNKSEGVVKIK